MRVCSCIAGVSVRDRTSAKWLVIRAREFALDDPAHASLCRGQGSSRHPGSQRRGSAPWSAVRRVGRGPRARPSHRGGMVLAAMPAFGGLDGRARRPASARSGPATVRAVPLATRSSVDMGGWPLSSRPGWGSRPFSDPDHPLTPKGAIGWSESIPGLKQPGRDESGAEGSHNDEGCRRSVEFSHWGVAENEWKDWPSAGRTAGRCVRRCGLRARSRSEPESLGSGSSAARALTTQGCREAERRTRGLAPGRAAAMAGRMHTAVRYSGNASMSRLPTAARWSYGQRA